MDPFAQKRRLDRTFGNSFHAEDLAEALLSFDAERPAAKVLETMTRRRLRVVGVREGGATTGYALREDLRRSRDCGGARRDFEDPEVVASDAPIGDVILALAGRERVFVRAFGSVAGIVTWSDVQKPAARMWLFGVITVVESMFTGLVERLYPDDSWEERVSKGRLEKAQAILDERRRLGVGANARLLDCLQIADKGQILLRSEETRRLLGFPSKDAGERALRRLARLRDNLAHAQDIVGDDGEVIVSLARRLEGVIGMASVFAAPGRRSG